MGDGEENPRSPFLFSNNVDRWLENALVLGISEEQFWTSTVGELARLFKAKKEAELISQRKQALFDYNLADLIGRSMSRLYSHSAKMPDIAEIYPSLFIENKKEHEEKMQEKKDELSALRFKQFAQSFNQKFNKEEQKD